ncbi:MAG: hypothetical protein WBD07_09920, partial [Vicinamibacterales bacterium]
SGSSRTPQQPVSSKATGVGSGFSRTAAASEPRPSPQPQRTARPEPVEGLTNFKDTLLAEIRKTKAVFYNTVVAQAQKIEIAGDRMTFVFSPSQRTLREMFEQNRAWLEGLAQQVSGRRIAVAGEQTAAPAPAATSVPDRKTTLREEALADASVQALLEVFPADIRDIEEI